MSQPREQPDGGGVEPALEEHAPEERELDLEQALTLLREGELRIEGRLIDASNATLFGVVERDGVAAQCVYKPVQGERPLWDFPDGTLAGREVASYEVSAATGWGVVPPTVLRDGPFGPGSCQLWIETDPDTDLQALARSDHPALRRMALLDAVINNGDRKGGHLLLVPEPGPQGHVYGVDHGVTFHVEDKLRTLLWGWRGQRVQDDEREVLERLRLDADLDERLRLHITRKEVAAYHRRIDRLLRTGRFPQPSEDWPAIPWPPF